MIKPVPKEISLNKSAIDDLMKRVLQDFIGMAIRWSFPEKSWRDIVSPVVRAELGAPNPKQVYRNINRDLRLMDISEYTEKNLDVTAAVELLLYHSEDLGLPRKELASIRHLWYSFRDSRNAMPGHSHGNETAYEIFEWGVIALGHMGKFIEKVYNSELFDEKTRDGYKRTYRNRIRQAKSVLELDYKAHLQQENTRRELEDLLRKVLDCDDPLAFDAVEIEYISRTSLRYDPEKYFDWVKLAASAGVDSAQQLLGDWYYEGNTLAGVEKDWSKALELYEAVDSLNPSVAIRLASLYANGISSVHSAKEGVRLISEYKQKWNIRSATCEDGSTEYYWIPSNRAGNAHRNP